MSEETNEGLGDDLKDKAKKAASEASEKASEFADDVKESAKEFSDSAKEEWNKVTDSKENKKMLAGLLAIFLGSLGIHKFILGYQKEGIIMLVVGVVGWFLCGIPTMLVWAVGVIEGIMYLTKSDEEFYNTYQAGQKPWF
ncbi:NINE protein [uncultured Dokdonia sp.]|uniref:NINE protein n=1 Tax=uncultured Dokdonia sp. TaxID=575653 RepID=UPI0026379F9B|nr:NINE protein [uncultured Dokdonia sp.]